MIQQNASASEEMASTSEELAAQAEQLQSIMEFFRIEDVKKRETRRTPAASSRKTAIIHKQASAVPGRIKEPHVVKGNGRNKSDSDQHGAQISLGEGANDAEFNDRDFEAF